MSKQYRITNISKTQKKPGIILDLGWNENAKAPGRTIMPNKSIIVDRMSDAMFEWQAEGLAKVETLEEPHAGILEVPKPASSEVPVHASVTQVMLPSDVADFVEPEPDLNMAVEATLPAEGVVAPKKTVLPNRARPYGGNANAKATVMGAEGVKRIDKNTEIDALNPLLDEKAKSIDNVSDKFTAKAPRQQHTGRTIET